MTLNRLLYVINILLIAAFAMSIVLKIMHWQFANEIMYGTLLGIILVNIIRGFANFRSYTFLLAALMQIAASVLLILHFSHYYKIPFTNIFVPIFLGLSILFLNKSNNQQQ